MGSKRKATEIENLVVWGSGQVSSSSPKATVTADIFHAMAVQRTAPHCNTYCRNGNTMGRHGTVTLL